MSRRLVAALACRNDGSRLYGKPLQNIVEGKTILDQIVDAIRLIPAIDAIVLGISEGSANLPFVEKARAYGVSHIVALNKME